MLFLIGTYFVSLPLSPSLPLSRSIDFIVEETDMNSPKLCHDDDEGERKKANYTPKRGSVTNEEYSYKSTETKKRVVKIYVRRRRGFLLPTVAGGGEGRMVGRRPSSSSGSSTSPSSSSLSKPIRLTSSTSTSPFNSGSPSSS